MVLAKGRKNDVDTVTLLQQRLNNMIGVHLEVDGVFGKRTEEIVMRFQKVTGLVVDGIVGIRTIQALGRLCGEETVTYAEVDKYLSEEDLIKAATELNVELAAVKAVAQVESGKDPSVPGAGFIAGKALILYEPHVFWRSLEGRGFNPDDYIEGNEDILYTSWKRGSYVYGLANYKKLDRAKEIDDSSAIMACSWGRFQILGENYKYLGYASPQDFEKRMQLSEAEQLEAFKRFIVKKKLATALKKKDFYRFAEVYNGPGQKVKYGKAIQRYYNKFSKQ